MSLNLSGRWEGQYTYGDDYPESQRGISFRFYLDCADKDGIISGTFTDDETSHAYDRPGTFQGFFENNFTSFVKLYPWYCESDENGNLVTIKDKPSQEIHYTGYLNNDMFEGEWEIHLEYIYETGEIGSFVYTGTWTMERVK